MSERARQTETRRYLLVRKAELTGALYKKISETKRSLAHDGCHETFRT